MLPEASHRSSFPVQRWIETTLVPDLMWAAKRYWARIILIGLVGLGAAIAYNHWSPEEFVSKATVRFIPPQVAESYVTSNVAMQVEQRIFAVTQMLRSRLTATQLIERYGLYPQLRRFYPVADLVTELQDHLKIGAIGSQQADDKRSVPSIEISFRYGNPEKAQQVVQRIVELIYEENRRYRSDQSIGTTDFLEQEVKTATEQIGKLEEQLAALPRPGGEAQGYEDLLKVENLHDLERRLTDLEHEMNLVTLDRNLRRSSVTNLESRLNAVLDQAATRVAPYSATAERLRAQIADVESRVVDLQRRYKPGQDERVAAENTLARLRQELSTQEDIDRRNALSRDVEDVEVQLSRARSELAGYEATLQRQAVDQARIKTEVASLRAQFAPKEDQETDRLNLLRQYQVAKDHYANLMKRQGESQMASSMERRGQGETAEMVEPPTLPLRPEFPGAIARYAIGSAIGMLIGYAFGLVSFVRRPMVRLSGHVEMLAGVAVLAELPGSLIEMKGGPGVQWQSAMSGVIVVLAVALSGCASKTSIRDEAIQKGRAAIQKHEYSAAVLHFRRAIQADAKAGEGYWGLSEAYAALGQQGLAYEQLIRAGEMLPGRVEVIERLAETTYQLYFADPGRPAAALREVEQLAQTLSTKWPNRPNGHRLLAQVLVERRHSKEAIDLMERVLEKLEDGSIRAQLASVYYQSGDRVNAERHLRRCLEANPQFSPGYDLLYLQLMAEQRVAEARAVLEAKTTSIDNLDSGLQLAAHDQAAGDRSNVEQQLSHLAERWGNNSETQARLGDFWIHRGQWNAARNWYEAGRDRHPGERSLYLGRLTDLLMAQKDTAGAKALVAAELVKNPGDTLMQAYGVALNMDSATGESERKRTQEQLESLVAKMPNSPFVRLHLGRAYLLNGNPLKAAEQMQNSVALDPNYAPGWLALAEAELAIGNTGQAQSHLDALLRRAPGYLPAQLLKAQASIQARKPADAEKTLAVLVSAEPDNTDAVLLLARARVALGRSKDAEAILSQAAARFPNDARLAIEEARIDLRSGRPRQALTTLQRAQRAGAKGMEIDAMVASAALTAGEAALAADRFRQLTEANPSNLEFRLGYAGSLGMLGKTKEAAAEFEQVQTKAGRDARPWLLYGALMASSGNVEAERRAYEEALKRDPENPFVLNNLAFLMARIGADTQKALTYAERAKRALPASWEVNDTLAYVYVRLGLARNALATLEEVSQNQRGAVLDGTREVMEKLRQGDLAEVRRRMEAGNGAQN